MNMRGGQVIDTVKETQDSESFDDLNLEASFGIVAATSIRFQRKLSNFANKKAAKFFNPRLHELRDAKNLNFSESAELQILESRAKFGLVLAASAIVPTFIPGIRPGIYGIYYVYTNIRIKVHRQVYKELDDILAEVDEETYTESQ
jgi:hypothetical protein